MSMSIAAFFTVYSHLDREGPGEPADVHWALNQIEEPHRVLDAACGSGADSLTLAKALPKAQIDAVEKHGPYVDQAMKRLQNHLTHVHPRQGDMLDVTGPYDLIWCTGAVYFKGINAALTAWKPKLTDQGVIAFSEPVLTNGWTDAATNLWDGYATQDKAGVLKQVADAGFKVQDTRTIQGAPWEAYYTSLQSRVDSLRANGTTPDTKAACKEAEAEIGHWAAAPQDIAYLLVLAKS